MSVAVDNRIVHSKSRFQDDVHTVPTSVVGLVRRKKQTKKKRRPRSDFSSLIQKSDSVIFMENYSRLESSGRKSNTSPGDKSKLPNLMRQPSIPLLFTSSRQSFSLSEGMPLPHERRRRVPLLTSIKPENERAEKERFMRANFNYNPHFIYRYPADPDVLKRFGVPSSEFLTQATHILKQALLRYGSYEAYEEETGGPVINKAQIVALIKQYLKQEGLESEVCVNLSEDLLSRGSMTRVKGQPVLNIRVTNLRQNWCEGLLKHEIGTHYLRSSNNKLQTWSNGKIRKDMGLRPLNPTEEGLASLHSVIFRKDPLLFRSAMLYYTTYQAAFLSFKELFKDLGRFIQDSNCRWDYCIRAKRGQIDTSRPGTFCRIRST